MRIKYHIRNICSLLIRNVLFYDYIIIPVVVLGIYLYCLYVKGLVNIDNNFMSSLISCSSVFTAFLFAAHTIIISFPDDKKFVVLLKEYGYYKKLFIELALAELLFGLCLIFSLFSINNNIASILFVMGSCYTVLTSKLLLAISFYISK